MGSYHSDPDTGCGLLMVVAVLSLVVVALVVAWRFFGW